MRAAGDVLAAALDYASAGLPVLPLDGKFPRNRGGLTQASTDPAVIADWWRRWPTANVGLRTGFESRLVVLDVDVGTEASVRSSYSNASTASYRRPHTRLPEAAVATTSSGIPALRFVTRLASWAPASTCAATAATRRASLVHENGRATGGCAGSNAASPTRPRGCSSSARSGGTEPRKVDKIIPEGRRRAAMLTVAGKLKRAGLTGEEILPSLRELNLRCGPPLDEAELESVAYKTTIDTDPETSIPSVPDAASRPIESGARNVPRVDAHARPRSCVRRMWRDRRKPG